MKVGIVGGGAVGQLVAAHLSSHFETTLYVRRHEQLKALFEQGVTLNDCHEMKRYSMKVKRSDEPFTDDLIIFAVKQAVLKENIEMWAGKCNQGQLLLFLQNGASHIPYLQRLSLANVYVGVIEFGSRKISDTMIEQNGHGQIKIGAVKGSLCPLKPLQGLVNFPVKLVEGGWEGIIFDKLIVNAVINPLTALFRVSNGELDQNPRYRQAARLLFEETSKVLYGGIQEEKWQSIMRICRDTSMNHSSMKQDVDSKRETEIDAITGYIIQKAAMDGLVCPLSQFVYFSILGLTRFE